MENKSHEILRHLGNQKDAKLCLKCTKIRLAAGLRPDPRRKEALALPQTPSRNKGVPTSKGISIHKNITMNDGSRIINLPEPSAGGEPATKSYVDSWKPIITIWAEQNGVIKNQKFEWSFGSGAERRTHRHSGYTMMASGRI